MRNVHPYLNIKRLHENIPPSPASLRFLLRIATENAAGCGNMSFLRKLVTLFKTSKKAPPADKGDQKYPSEETPDALKAGIIKELIVQQHSIPEDIDILVEIIKVAQAGGCKFDVKQIPDMVPNPFTSLRKRDFRISLMGRG